MRVESTCKAMLTVNEANEDTISTFRETDAAVDLRIGFITVFDAILTGRQSGQKLESLYGSPKANNSF